MGNLDGAIKASGSLARFDLRAVWALTIGTAAVLAVARYDSAFGMLLAGRLVVLWAISAACGGDSRRRLRVLGFGLIGALLGTLPVVPITVLIWADAQLRPTPTVAVSSTLTLAGALFGLLDPALHRRVLRGVLLLVLAMVLALAGLAYRRRHEILLVGTGDLCYRSTIDGSRYVANTDDDEIFQMLRQWLGLSYISFLHVDLVETGDVLPHIGGLTELRAMTLEGSQLTDPDLAHFRSLRNLEVLHLYCPNLRGDGLEHLAALPRLTTLVISQAKLDRPGLGYLKRCPKLSVLNIESTDLNVSQLREIQSLKLGALILHGVPLDDEHVAELCRLKVPNLELYYTGISTEQAERIRKAFAGRSVLVYERPGR